MPEKIAYIIVGAFTSSVIVFLFSYFRSKNETHPHKTPCQFLTQLQQEHYALVRTIEAERVRETSQWLRIENLIGGFSATIAQLIKRIEQMENQISTLISQATKQQKGD